MNEEIIEMSTTTSPRSSCTSIPKMNQIEEALKILDERNWTNVEEFLDPWGKQRITLAHLAAYRGNIKMLRLATYLEATDEFGRCALHYAAHQGHFEVIRWLLERSAAEDTLDGMEFLDPPYHPQLSLPDSDGRTPVHYAVEGKHVEVLQLLVNAGADVNACDEREVPPIYLAHCNVDRTDPDKMLRYKKIVDILVSAKASVDYADPETGWGILYHAVKLNSHEATEKLISNGADVFQRNKESGKTILHFAAEAGVHETLRTILEHPEFRERIGSSFDVIDKAGDEAGFSAYGNIVDGWTPLHCAVFGGNPKCIRILIKKGLCLANETNTGMTVLDAIFEKVPNPVAFLTEILDEQVTATDNSCYKVTLDFRILTAPPSAQYPEPMSDSTSDLHVIFALINAVPSMGLMSILQHPLLATFLHQKYLPAIPRNLVLSLLHVCFVSCLSWHAICIDPIDKECMVLTASMMLFASLAFLLLDVTVFLRKMSRSNLHIKRYKIPMYVALHVSILIFVFSLALFINTLKCQSSCNYPSTMPHTIAIMILLSWTKIMLVLGRFPLLGEYAFMFFAVLLNVGKVLSIFACLIIGFALSFSVLFSGTAQFSSPWNALAKTLVMMTGEYDYDDLFPSNEEKNNTSKPITTMIVLLIFIMVTSIGLMNLMVGLAVSDIEGLLKEGHTRRLMKQADSAIPWSGILRRFSTMTTSGTMELDLKSSTWFSYFGIPADVKKALYDLAMKNFHRNKEPQSTPSRENREDTISEMKSLLKKILIELQRQNSPLERTSQDSNEKIPKQRKSL